MPAIKGDMYINTHCNYSQPTLIKLYNENIGGHLTPLQYYTHLQYSFDLIHETFGRTIISGNVYTGLSEVA